MNAKHEAGEAGSLITTTEGGVRILTLNRPDRLNALSDELQDRLIDAFLDASTDPDVRVLVLTATGDRVFCPGVDIKEASRGDDAGARFVGPMHRSRRLVMEVLGEVMKPTIVALNGTAVGGGFELALACDIRIAVAGAQLGLPEAKIGMGAIYASIVLPRMIPTARAFEMLFTGEYMTVEEGERWGLINRVVKPDELQPVALEMARKIAANAPISVRRMKEMALKGMNLPIASALRLDVGPDPYTSDDRKEGLRAFLAKTVPQWTGR